MTDWLINAINSILAANGLGFEIFVFLLVFIAGFLFCIQDYRIGFMAFLMLSIGEFIFMYLLGFNWIFALMSLILAIMLMSFGIFSSRNNDVGMIA